VRHLPADSSKPARKGADLRTGDSLASAHEKRGKNCWGQAACINGILGAMASSVSPEAWEELQMLRGFSGMGSVVQLVY